MTHTLLLISLISLVAVPTITPSMGLVSKDRCLHVCSCTGSEEKVYVRCQRLPEGRWPAVFPENTNSLDLSWNPLHNVNAFSLQGKGLENLISLNLSNCRLTTIDLEAFKSLQRLTFLDLSYNDIKELNVEHFKDLPSLQVIRLAGFDRQQCKRLRAKLPEVSVHCGGHVTTSPSTRKDVVIIESNTEPTVISTVSTTTSMPKTTSTSTATATSTSTSKSTLQTIETMMPTPMSSTPRYTETPVTPKDTNVVDSEGVGSGTVAAIGIACFVVGALAVVLGFVAWRWRKDCKQKNTDNEDPEQGPLSER